MKDRILCVDDDQDHCDLLQAALTRLGRTEEARRAAASFRERFPRSVLFPAVSQMPASEP